MSTPKQSRSLLHPLLIAALAAPLPLTACSKEESNVSMPSSTAAQPAPPPSSSPPMTTTPPSAMPAEPTTGSEPAK